MPPSASLLLPGAVPASAAPDGGRDALHPGAIVRIDRVAPADAALLMALCDEQAAERGGRQRVRSSGDVAWLEFHEALFDPPVRAWAWLARVDGREVGYAGATASFAFPERAYYLHLETVYLQPAWRHRGLERRLLAQARETARQLGCAHLTWHQPHGMPASAVAAASGVVEYRLAIEG